MPERPPGRLSRRAPPDPFRPPELQRARRSGSHHGSPGLGLVDVRRLRVRRGMVDLLAALVSGLARHRLPLRGRAALRGDRRGGSALRRALALLRAVHRHGWPGIQGLPLALGRAGGNGTAPGRARDLRSSRSSASLRMTLDAGKPEKFLAPRTGCWRSWRASRLGRRWSRGRRRTNGCRRQRGGGGGGAWGGGGGGGGWGVPRDEEWVGFLGF